MKNTKIIIAVCAFVALPLGVTVAGQSTSTVEMSDKKGVKTLKLDVAGMT